MKVMKIDCDTNSSTFYFEYVIQNDWIVRSAKIFGSHTTLHIMVNNNEYEKKELVSCDLCNYNQSIGGVPPISTIDLGSYVFDEEDSCCMLPFSLQAKV